MKIYKIFAAVALIFISTACSKEFLDRDVNGVLPLEAYFQTEEDIQEGVMACYDVLQWAYAADWNSMYMVKTLPSDETNAGGGNDGDQPPYQQLDDYSWDSENPAVSQAFTSMYYGISRANAVINSAEGDTAYKKQMIAEAKALRAYFYFELVSMFGKVPLMLVLPKSAEEYAQAGAPISEIYDQIEKDLTEAIVDLPRKSAWGAENAFRMSQGAAQSILGKAHLYQQEWAQAAAAFDAVIGTTEYSLQADYSTLFLKESEYGVESVFEISFLTSEGYDWGTFQWGGNRAMENNIHLQLMGPRGDYFDAGTSGIVGGWGFNYPTDEAYQVFLAEGDVVRGRASVMSVADLEAENGAWNDGGNAVWGYEGYFRVKYGSIAAETNGEDGAVPELNYGTNQRLIRYSDVLLMAAEAKFMNNGGGQAEFDMVRNRPGGLAPKTISMNAIKIERQLELAFEGVRLFDLIRWGDAPAGKSVV